MLILRHHPKTGQKYLAIRNDFAKAWIEHYPRLGDHLEHLGEIPDWRLWVAPPGRPANRLKSPTRLLIESQLRAWVLRRCGRCLPTLSFAELCSIAQLQAGHEASRNAAVPATTNTTRHYLNKPT